MLVDLYASQPHYAEHMLPIWNLLPAELRGRAFGIDGRSWWGDRLPADYRPKDRLVLVAGFRDVERLAAADILRREAGL